MIPELEWTDLDRKAVDTVTGAGDGRRAEGRQRPPRHRDEPGAGGVPAVPEGDAARPGRPRLDRPRPVRALARPHSITLYIQLYLGGFGLELDDLKSLRTWGSKTPGHPEFGHTAGVEVTTGPLGQGVGNAVGMAMAARRERGLLDPDAAPGESLVRPPHLRHRLRRRPPGGRERRGVVDRRHPGARQPHRHLRRQPDLDRGRHRHRLHRGRRPALRGLRLARPDRRLDPRRHTTLRRGRPGALRRDPEGRRAVTDQPRSSCCRTIIAWPAPNAQNTGRPTARRSATTRSPRPRRCSASTPTQTFEVARRRPRAHPSLLERGKAGAGRVGAASTTPGPRKPSAEQAALLHRMKTRDAARGLGRRRCPTFDADAKGVATRAASGQVINAIAPAHARAVGRLGRPRRLQQHHDQGRPSFLPGGPLRREVAGRPVRRPGAPLRHPRARHGRDHERHRRPRRHPRLRRHVPHVLRLHARLGPPGRADAGCRSPTSGPTTRSASARTARPTSRSSTSAALRAIPGLDVVRPADANETAAAWQPILEHTDRPAGLILTRQNVPTFPRGDGRVRRRPTDVAPGRLRPLDGRAAASPT